MYKDPETRMTAARTRLLLDYPWFGALSMRLKIEQSSEIETFATDGTRLAYNPEFLAKVSDQELAGIIAHEVMHCALLHPYRRGDRDLKRWNMATDYAINGELLKSKLVLPDDCLHDPQYDGLSAEVIYSRLPQDSGNDSGAGDQSTGTVNDAPQDGAGDSPADSKQMTESDWKVAAEQATNVARACGKVPGAVAELIKQARQEPADWRAILREFVEHTVPSDYSWLNPNRRFISNGIYLPGMVKENLGKIAIAVDTSGSIDSGLLAAFSQELNSILSDARPDGVQVIYCDSKVHKVQDFAQDEPVELQAIGRGGTAFNPVFDAVNAQSEQPACLIYFTDLDSSDTPQAPEYPVLWATDLSVTKQGPFGQTVRITK